MPVFENDWPATESALKFQKGHPARTLVIGFSATMVLMAGAILFLIWGGTAHTIVFFGLTALAFATLCISYAAVNLYVVECRQTERELQSGKESAEQAYAAKSALAAEFARQCRTSLTAILGYCDLPDDAEHPAAEHLAAIQRNASQILTILDKPTDLPVRIDRPGLLDDGSNTLATSSRKPLAGRVLLAEDDLDNQKVIAFYLTEAGADVTIVPDGNLACEIAIAAKNQACPFDLILMDVRMPTVDGCAATTMLRQNDYTSPIVALTADATRADRDKCMTAGFNDFLAKPIDRVQCLSILSRYLRPTGAASTAPDNEVPVEAEFAGLRESFRSELPSRLAAIEGALASKNAARVGDMAHQLKGTAGCYGFLGVSEAAAALQTAAEQPQPEGLPQCVARLAAQCQRALPAKAA